MLVGPGFRDWTLAIKSRITTWKSAFVKIKSAFKKKLFIFLHIPSSWIKIWVPIKKTQLPWYLWSWWKAMSGKKKEERQKSVLTIASYACNRHHGWRTQAAWTNSYCFLDSCTMPAITALCQSAPYLCWMAGLWPGHTPTCWTGIDGHHLQVDLLISQQVRVGPEVLFLLDTGHCGTNILFVLLFQKIWKWHNEPHI